MTYNLPVGRERHADVSAKLEICFAKLSGRPGERYTPRNRVVAVAAPPLCPYARGSWPYEDEVRARSATSLGTGRRGVWTYNSRARPEVFGARLPRRAPRPPGRRQCTGTRALLPSSSLRPSLPGTGKPSPSAPGRARIHTAGTEVRGIRTAVSNAISKKENAEAYKLKRRYTGPSSVPCRWAWPRFNG